MKKLKVNHSRLQRICSDEELAELERVFKTPRGQMILDFFIKVLNDLTKETDSITFAELKTSHWPHVRAFYDGQAHGAKTIRGLFDEK